MKGRDKMKSGAPSVRGAAYVFPPDGIVKKQTCPAVCATPKPTGLAGGCPAGVSRSLPPLAAEAGREVCNPLRSDAGLPLDG